MVFRLAILNSHPVQYFAPLYRRLAEEQALDVTVYYGSRQGLDVYEDPGFLQSVRWDVSLLSGYRSVFARRSRLASPSRGFWNLRDTGVFGEIRRQRYDALWIHGHNYSSHLLAWAAARLFRTPVLVRGETHLGLQRSRAKRLLRRWMMPLLYSQAAGALAIGSRNHEFYSAMGVPSDRIFSVPYVVDVDSIRMATERERHRRDGTLLEAGLPPDRPVVLYAGKLTERKHPDHAMAAVASLQRSGVACSLLVVGDGPLRHRMQELQVELGTECVAYVGFRNQSEMPRFLASADVFVLPAENEPWGLAINEAMAAGLPIVTTDEVGCVPDLVHAGVNGAVHAVGDIAGLTDALRPLLLDSDLRAQWGRASLQRVEQWTFEECVAGVREAVAACRTRRRGAH